MCNDELFEKVERGLDLCKEDSKFCFDNPSCPYESEFPRCCCALMADALALIRSQQARIKELEAAQTARVMTLEEVKNSEIVYFEDYADPDDSVEPIIRPAVNVEVKNGGIVMLDSILWDEGFTFNSDSDYGKTWRCWTARPTDEQREAIPWKK